jgi:hypothetical protein
MIGLFLAISILCFYTEIIGKGVQIYSFFIAPLSFYDVYILAKSTVDKAIMVKDYFDFRHKNITTCIKGTSALIIVTLGALLKSVFDNMESMPNNIQISLSFGILVLLIINSYLFYLLNSCIKDYKNAIILLERLK